MGGFGSPLERLEGAAKELTKLSELDSSLSELQDRLESVIYEVEDIAAQIRQYADTVEFNQGRLDEITMIGLHLYAKLKTAVWQHDFGNIRLPTPEAEQKLETIQLGSEKQEAVQGRDSENSPRGTASMYCAFRETATCCEAPFRAD